MPLTYENLKTPQNTDSGIADYILIAPAASFETIACVPAVTVDNNENSEVVTIVDTHVFTSGEGFRKFVCSPSKNMLSAKFSGEKGSMKTIQTLKAFLPGSYTEVHAQIARLMNEGLIVLVKDSNCDANMHYQLGCDCVYAYFTPDGGFETGTNADGHKGYNITIEYTAKSVHIYTGAISLYV